MKWWEALVTWLRASGGAVDSPGVVEARESALAGGGVGLFAARALDAGEQVLSVPDALWVKGDRFELCEWFAHTSLTRDMMRMREEVCTEEEHRDLPLCHEAAWAGAEESKIAVEKWEPYLSSLPSLEDRAPSDSVFFKAAMAHPDDLEPADLESMAAAAAAAAAVVEPTDPLVVEALEYAPQWIGHVDQGMKRWLYGQAIVASRMHIVWELDAAGDWVATTALVPVADLFNGALAGDAVNVACETNKETNSFDCKATKDVPKDAELIVRYGDEDASAEALQRTYGTLSV